MALVEIVINSISQLAEGNIYYLKYRPDEMRGGNPIYTDADIVVARFYDPSSKRAIEIDWTVGMLMPNYKFTVAEYGAKELDVIIKDIERIRVWQTGMTDSEFNELISHVNEWHEKENEYEKAKSQLYNAFASNGLDLTK